MITHYIIMSSSYSNGTRIALDYLVNEKDSVEKIKEIMNTIIESCGKDVSLSTHIIQTDSYDFDSVKQRDFFFKDVELIKSLDEFINLINIDRELIGLDIAKYILCKVKCTHLKLEKLVYLCYADYLCTFNKSLFKDKIYAYKYGPVVETVYSKYKMYGYKEVEQEKENINNKNIYEMPAKSRILFARDGIEKLSCVERVIKKYGNYTAGKLVEITHRPFSPWSKTENSDNYNTSIDDMTIKKYHIYEK